jgi:hypothetical protein
MLASPEVAMIPDPKRSDGDDPGAPEPPPRLAGFPLFFQQLSALLRKNFTLALRNRTATFLQLLSSVFFILLIFSVDQAVNSRRKVTSAFRNVPNPQAQPVTPIPACETGYYIKPPCFDFIWSGNASSVSQAIVQNIMKNNPGRPITSDKVCTRYTCNPILHFGHQLISFSS